VLRAARAYRTVSYAAAALLAGAPPLELLARGQALMYWRVRGLRERGINLGLITKGAIRRQVVESVLVDWQRQLSGPAYESREW